ncbi:MAG: hypothetical protein IT379_12780 [Deltaproteobacteria bacterium]|nr:hypothetical protein [Deltaproteobacteria bacterium]
MTRKRWIVVAGIAAIALALAIWRATSAGDDDTFDPNAPRWTWRGQLRDVEPLSDLPNGTPCMVVAIPQPTGIVTAAVQCGALALHRIPCPCDLDDADGRAGATPRLTCACERIFRCDTRAGRCDLDASRLGFALHVAVNPTPTLEPPGASLRPRGIGNAR